jgi:hypothetical protein
MDDHAVCCNICCKLIVKCVINGFCYYCVLMGGLFFGEVFLVCMLYYCSVSFI